MDAGKKKALLVKAKAVGRMLKEYNNYKVEVGNFDLTQIAQDKKQAEFYKESTDAMEFVKKNLVDYVLALESLMIEGKEDLQGEDDPLFVGQIQKGREDIETVRNLFPAEL